MSNKTISINPNILSVKDSKTKKNTKDKPEKIKPLIPPNVLKRMNQFYLVFQCLYFGLYL